MVELRRKSKPAPTSLEPPRDPEDWIRRATADGDPSSEDPPAPFTSSSPPDSEQSPSASQSDDKQTPPAASAPPDKNKKSSIPRPSSDERATQSVTRSSTKRDRDSIPSPASSDPTKEKKEPSPKRRTPPKQSIPPERVPHPGAQDQSATGSSSPVTEHYAVKRRIPSINAPSEKPGKSPKEPSIHETETMPPGKDPSTKKGSPADKKPIPPALNKEVPPSNSTTDPAAPPARFISFAMDSLTLDLFRDIAFDLDLGNAATLAHIIETCAALPDEAFREFPESRVLIGHNKRTMSFLLPELTIDTFYHLARRLRFRNKSALYRYLIQMYQSVEDMRKQA